ncbi:hypothetical protein MAR_000463 [Mya arenaria]|uniref:EF-hand domain-containing protein n=1 Tax=Mya arenaria TaxID=6604 RepID=A0ABY7F9A7_MYAAR|nr:hypothetical protein MAR_000463 [Mya arenaria]
MSDMKSLTTAMGELASLKEATPSTKGKGPAKKKVRQKGKKSVAVKQRQSEVVTEDNTEEAEFVYSWPSCSCGMRHAPVPFFSPPDGIRCTYYWQLADHFPFMTLYRVLTTEIQFLKADVDQSGVIELGELKELIRTVLGIELSDRMVEKTFNEIDTDGSGTLDFLEVISFSL